AIACVLACAALPVLAGTVFAVVNGALRAAPHVLAHTAIDLVLRLVALGHRVLIGHGLRIAPSSVPAFAGTDRCCTEATGSTAGRETPPAQTARAARGF